MLVTRVYDQEDGVMLFEDIEKSSIARIRTIDDGQFQLVENQDQRVMEDSAGVVFHQERGNGSTLLASDLAEPVQSQPAVNPQPSKLKDKRAREKKDEAGSESSDERTPLERSMLTGPAAKRAKTTEKTTSGGSRVSTANGAKAVAGGNGSGVRKAGKAKGAGTVGGGGGGTSSDNAIKHLLEEVDDEMQKCKAASSMRDIKEETLANLAGRLNGKQKPSSRRKVGRITAQRPSTCWRRSAARRQNFSHWSMFAKLLWPFLKRGRENRPLCLRTSCMR